MIRALFDTSIALRLFDVEDSRYVFVSSFVNRLIDEGFEIVFAPQVLFEARVVLTRPKSDNGKGRSPREFSDLVNKPSVISTLLPEPPDLVERWLGLCNAHNVIGKRSHDVRLVAWMQAHGVDTILTLNPKDFASFPIAVLAPGTIQA